MKQFTDFMLQFVWGWLIVLQEMPGLIGIHLSALAFIIGVKSVFFSDKNDRYRPRVLYNAYSHRFACKWLAIFHLYQARYQWKQFHGKCFWSETKIQLKVCKTVSVFLRRVWAPVSVANMYAKYDSRGYALREHTQCWLISICICICIQRLRNLSNISGQQLSRAQVHVA